MKSSADLQNLALAVGLSGRFQEAQKIAAGDLPPDQAAANIAYLKSMLAEERPWKKLKATDTVEASSPGQIPAGPAKS